MRPLSRLPGVLLFGTLGAGAVLSVLFALGGCAAAPTPAPVTAAVAPRAQTTESSLVCGEGAAFLSWEQLGVPQEARPVQLVKIGPRIWVLFEPARLVRIDRRGEAADIGMRLGSPGENWSSIALDSVDGSLWLAARDRLVLWHYEAAGSLRAVPIQNVEGEGGFYDLAAAPSGLFVVPTAAEHAVWRIGRDGKVLGTDFPVPPIDPERFEAAPSQPTSAEVRLEHDASGAVLAWFSAQRLVYRADAAGHWAPVDPGIFSSGGDEPVRGVDVGTKNEHWFANGRGSLFYWKGTPVFLGAHSMLEQQGKQGTVFHFPGGRDLFEACNGWFILDVATDPSGYAALTDRGVVIGDFAAEPAAIHPEPTDPKPR